MGGWTPPTHPGPTPLNLPRFPGICRPTPIVRQPKPGKPKPGNLNGENLNGGNLSAENSSAEKFSDA